MHIVINILAALLAIFVVILIHECGHFWVARAVGIRVLKFSIGFGKAIWSRTAKNGTVYAIGVLPLGGYVKMLGEGDEHVKQSDLKQAFNRKSVWARMAVTLAGPLANFVLALVLFWGVYLGGMTHIKPVIGQVKVQSIAAKAGLQRNDGFVSIAGETTHNWQQVMMQLIAQAGNANVAVQVRQRQSGHLSLHQLDLSAWSLKSKRPQVLQSLGIAPYTPQIAAKVAKVAEQSPAALAGLEPGDVIVAIDGQPVNNWQQAVLYIERFPGQQVQIRVRRDAMLKQLEVTLGVTQHDGGKRLGFLGVMVTPPQWPESLQYHEHFSLLTAWLPAWRQTLGLISFNATVLWKMISGNISVATLGGPISIFQNAGQASQAGIVIYLGFIAFISVALGFINLLPIPILDGGHFLFQLIELIFRKPVPMRFQFAMLKVGLFIILLVMVQATVNDISRLF